MAFAKKTWKDRIAEFPTRRRLTKEDNTSELVTVAREEGTLSQEGDAFSAENMNDLENRIDAEFTEVNGKLDEFRNEEILYAQPTATGVWAPDTFTNRTLADSLSNYNSIIVAVCTETYQLVNPVIIPINIFKNMNSIESNYVADQKGCAFKYIDDNTIGVATIYYGCIIIGIK